MPARGMEEVGVEHAMEKVFAAPGALGHESGGPCARCKRSEPVDRGGRIMIGPAS